MNIYHERRSSGRSASVEDGRDMTAVVTMNELARYHTRHTVNYFRPPLGTLRSYDACRPPPPPRASSPLRLCLAATAS